MIQTKNLRRDLVAAHRASLAGTGLKMAGLQLGIRFRHHFGITVAGHHRVTMQTQYRGQKLERLSLGDRFFRYQVDLAFDARIDDERRIGVIADCRDHRLDIGIDEIERALVRAGSFIRAGYLVHAAILGQYRLHTGSSA